MTKNSSSLPWIRSKSNDGFIDPLRLEAEDKSDIVLVATPDLINYVSNGKLQYVPNPVDTEHFFRKSQEIITDRYFAIKTHQTDMEWMLNYLAENGFDAQVDIIDRVSNPISYSEIPNLIRQYGTYIDIRYIDGVLLNSLSKTALESLARGLRVLKHDLELINGLPESNRPERIVNRIMDIYK